LVRFASLGDVAVRDRIVCAVMEDGYITNSRCRSLLGVGYDEAIAIFNWLLADGVLVRVGKRGGTRYVLPTR
jgi:hypothetical protein